MPLIPRVFSLWRNLVHRARVERDLDDEVRAAFDLLVEEKTRAGMRPEEARRAATLELGRVEAVKEQVRDVRAGALVDTCLHDVRHAFRLLRNTPAFTTTAVLSLALGIGVNTAMFSVVNTVLLRPLPYPQPAQLVRLVQHDGRSDVSIPEYKVVAEESRAFSAVTAYRGVGDRRLDWGSTHEWISALAVSADFLRTLGVPLAMGREFNADETRISGPQAVILTDSLWRNSFGTDPAILGRTITLDGTPFTIVGVLPADFWFPQRTDVLIPLRPSGGLGDLGMNTQALARLENDVDVRQAQAEIAALTESFRRARAGYAPPTYRGLAALSYHNWLVSDVRLNLLLLFGATALLLLIACGNLAMLLMTRFAARGREIAVRVALGSSPRRLLAQFLVENLVIALFGAAAGVMAAYGLLGGLVAWMPFHLPAARAVRLDGAVLAFAVSVAIVTAVVFTLVPLFLTRGLHVQQALTASGRTPGSGGVHARTRNLLVVGEVALSTTLLIAAGLLIQSLYRLQHEPLGFKPHGLITFATPLDRDRLPTAADRSRFTGHIRERLESLPGVRGVAATNVLPLAGRMNLPAQREGRPEQSSGAMEIRLVTTNYFEMLGIPIRSGRAFNPDDSAASLPVVVVNETVARTWWQASDPIGDRLIIGVFKGKRLTNDPPREVVGVVGDTKTTTLKDPPWPTVFVPIDQAIGDASSVTWVVKTEASVGFAAQLRATIAEIEPRQRVVHLRTMDDIVESTTATSRFNASLFAIFASVALVLAVIGLYGVLSFLVARRRHEIGTRMALGASREEVVRLFLRQGITLTSIGLAVGLTAALLITRWMSTLLYAVRPDDPSSFAAVGILLLFVGLVASYLPARRAATVDPTVALRME